MSGKLILYDLASRDPSTSWSFNVWKIRLVLNYKKIPYETFWLDHHTIGTTLKALGVPPNTSGHGFEYTVPTVKLPGGEIITDSAAIAEKLEALYPSPSIWLNAELQAETERVIRMTAFPLFCIYYPWMVKDVVREDTIEKFVASRLKVFGVSSLEEWEKEKGGEVAWKAAGPGFVDLKKLLTERKVDEGPFILGSRVCYADFNVVALLEAFKRAGGSDLFARSVGWDPVFRTFYDAAEQWTKADN